MKLKINFIKDNNLKENEYEILVRASENNKDVNNLLAYINDYTEKKITVTKNNEIIEIKYADIILFYSDKKFNYCRTKQGEFKIKSKLYELERSNDFVRISKSCIINVNHVESFDIGETGKIIVKLDDKKEEIVARRRIKSVLDFLDERSI